MVKSLLRKSPSAQEGVKILSNTSSLSPTIDEAHRLYLLAQFSKKSISKSEAVKIVSKMTEHIFEHTSLDGSVILIPILRAGIAMWQAAVTRFNNAESAFPTCNKNKGTSQVDIVWPAYPKFFGKRVILLDVVSATGDTINAVFHEILKRCPSLKGKVEVACCYISPEAVQAIRTNPAIGQMHIFCTSKTVDKNGYLIPSTQGDVGDKLFGKKRNV